MADQFPDDPLHRHVFPDRKCAVGNHACQGRVMLYGPAMLCAFHVCAWEDAEQASKVDRMRTWVRAQRADVPPTGER